VDLYQIETFSLDIGKMITKELKLVHAGEEMYGFGD
jgi:hypothetical protein